MSLPSFDVVVVGSGASGGWACKHLSEAGLRVALVDAGRVQKDSNFTEHKPAFELPYRDRSRAWLQRTRFEQSKAGCNEFNADWFVNDIDEPFTYNADKPYTWQGRVRMTGGRTNVWGRQSYRLSDLDFKAASHDGYGTNWPISYADVAPYYDIVERYVGITGMPEGVPELPDGHYHPPMGITCAEMRLRTRVKDKLGRTITLGRSANITKPINGRAPCHYCGPCHQGCITHSYFNAAFTTVADALKTGRTTHIPNAMVYQVLMDKATNRATGVSYVDRNTRQLHEVRAPRVILCAQASESVRILFNSATPQHPQGLGNSSGVLGHYLMDHIMGGGAFGEFPDMAPDRKVSASSPRRPDGMYVIRFRNTLNGPKHPHFLRGYGFQGGGGPGFNFNAPGFGEAFKKGLLETRTGVGFGGFGECLARYENYCEIDPQVADIFGIPVLKFHMAYSDNELAMVKDMAVTAAEMLEAAGAKNIHSYASPSRPGNAIHEVGIARMGDDPKSSVLNSWQQTHDVANLYVMDGAGFTSTACQNPTLTIMALTVRNCDHLLAEMKKGNA